MQLLNIQLFAENPAQTTEQEVAGTVQKTEAELEAEKVAKEAETKALEEKAQADLKAKEEAEKTRNAEEARKRREKELQDKLEMTRLETRNQTIIDAIGTNPFNNKPIKDADDVETYLIMKRIKDENGDPINDYPDYVKKHNKELVKKQEEKTRVEEQAMKDVDEFQTAHPKVNLTELMKDEDFILFSEGKLGNQPLTKIYDGYQKFIGKYQKMTAEEKAKKEEELRKAREEANRVANPGSQTGNPTGAMQYYTKEQLQKMTVEEWKANEKKALESAKYHNMSS